MHWGESPDEDLPALGVAEIMKSNRSFERGCGCVL